MKKIVFFTLSIFVLVLGFQSLSFAEAKGFRTFRIYSDASSPDNHYTPSGWMGDYADLDVQGDYLEEARSGTTSVRIQYTPTRAQGKGWAGVYWLNPSSNWGLKDEGYDLTGATKLTFWVKGAVGGEMISKFGVGGVDGKYSDSSKTEIGPIRLSKEWTQYEIDLTGKDLSSIIGGFFFAADGKQNRHGITFYIDDIVFL